VLLYLTALSANIHRGDSGIFFPHSAHRIFLLFAASIAVSIAVSIAASIAVWQAKTIHAIPLLD
jgi:hypothetical protein